MPDPRRPECLRFPDARARLVIQSVAALRQLGLPAPIAAALAGSSAPTLRRWAQRLARGEHACLRSGPARAWSLSADQIASVRSCVRQMRGLIGADALRRQVPGTSRRACLALKRDELTRMERDRRAGCDHVALAFPGILRGFDAMHVHTTGGWRFLLVAADATIPYRTLIHGVPTYDHTTVLEALQLDIARHGAPLVYRLDRAKAHDVPEVRDFLAALGVLVLHGPPRHPCFYGQLERQNREHRAWLNSLGPIDSARLPVEAERMRFAFNSALPRATLGWRTATDLWNARPSLIVDRALLREEVSDRAARIRRQNDLRGRPADFAERLAIEAALIQRGWLCRKKGERC